MSVIKRNPARTIVISVHSFLNQWLVRLTQKHFSEILCSIDPSLKDVRVIVRHEIHNSDYVLVEDGLFQSADIFISDKPAKLPYKNEHVFPRYSKVVQAAMLQQAYNEGDYPHMVVLPTYSITNVSKNSLPVTPIDLPYVEKGKWIIRPTDGARGLGQIIVDTNVIDLHHAFAKFKDAWLIEESPILPDGVHVYRGDIHYPEEAVNELRNSCFVQKLQENIKTEYRVIVGTDGLIDLIMERPRDDVGCGDLDYKAVTSEHDSVVWARHWGDPLDLSLGGSPEVLDELQRMIHALNLRCNSLDVFIANDNGSIKWGLFEFCNQFSLQDMPMSISQNILMRWYKDVLSQYLYK